MTRHGCYNLPREVPTYVAQDGWNVIRDGLGNPHRIPRHIDVPHAMSTDCRYDKAQTDSKCAGCSAKPEGEA
jgi:hypothetical protein